MALAVAAVAIALLAIRPRRIPEWVWPAGGALLLVALRDEPLAAAGRAIAAQWNIFCFIAGLMVLSAAAQLSGAFRWIADLVVERAGGSRRRLFVLVFLACSAVTVLLSNDATAIALTPIVYQAVRRHTENVKVYLFGCVFAANTASFGLPFSNPANVLILPRARLGPYVWHLGPPQLAAIAINLAAFLFFFRRELEGRYEPARLYPPQGRTRATLFTLAVVAAGYFAALVWGWPLGPVALAGGACAAVTAGAGIGPALRGISWRTLTLLGGLFVLLDAVTRAGFLQWAVVQLDRATQLGSLAAIGAAATGSALLSNALNNLPVAVAASYVVTRVSAAHLAYPLILGVDVGPNLLTAGSLATLLWLGIVRGYGIRIGALEYLRLGALVVPATLAAGILWLAFAR